MTIAFAAQNRFFHDNAARLTLEAPAARRPRSGLIQRLARLEAVLAEAKSCSDACRLVVLRRSARRLWRTLSVSYSADFSGDDWERRESALDSSAEFLLKR